MHAAHARPISADMQDIAYHSMPRGPRIAFRHAPPAALDTRPTLVFLPGYMSDMDGGKATALFAHAREQGRGCLLLDYSGCGRSEGDFADGTLSRWRDEVLTLIAERVSGPVTLVGSSMGGWLMLLVALGLASGGNRLAGMVGIAAAPDFSDWGFDADQKAQLRRGETVLEDNPYGPEPTPTYASFWQDAVGHEMLGSAVPLDCPVRLLHGQRDADVPWQTSLRLAEALGSDDIQVLLVKGADHRMSRDEDVALLLRVIDDLDPSAKSTKDLPCP